MASHWLRVLCTVSEMSLHCVHKRRVWGHLPQSITVVSTVAAGASAQECPAPLTLQRVPCSQPKVLTFQLVDSSKQPLQIGRTSQRLPRPKPKVKSQSLSALISQVADNECHNVRNSTMRQERRKYENEMGNRRREILESGDDTM